MKKQILSVFLISCLTSINFIVNESHQKTKKGEISFEQLYLSSISIADEGGGTCVADDPGECVAVATCPGGGNSVCCVGIHCTSGKSVLGNNYYVECDYSGESWVYC